MKYFHDRMNIFKRSWIIPVLFKHITKIFGENYLSLLRYTADQLWFLKIKSLQITLGLPQDPSRLLAGGEFGANGKCVYLFVIPCGPWGPGQIPDIRDTGAVIRSTTSLQGSRIRSQTWPWPSELGRHPHTPLLPSPRSGRLPWVETPGWDIMVCNGLCLPTSPLPEGRAGSHRRGPFFSTVHFLSQLWNTMHPSTQLPARERDVLDLRAPASCLWLYTQL
jgi:hypothetical protein